MKPQGMGEKYAVRNAMTCTSSQLSAYQGHHLRDLTKTTDGNNKHQFVRAKVKTRLFWS
jgi:hypothetical protein